MSAVSPSSAVLTVINVFTVAPENQARLIDLLMRATGGDFYRDLPFTLG